MRQSGLLEGEKGRDTAKAGEASQPDIGTYSTVCCRILLKELSTANFLGKGWGRSCDLTTLTGDHDDSTVNIIFFYYLSL
jgi:hypothetical protein